MLYRDKDIYISKKSKGFALPSVLIASLIMLIVLFASMSSVISVRSAIKQQYYNQLSKTAADAGLVYARACLDVNGGIPQTPEGISIKPNTDCTGQVIANACEDLQSSNPPTCTSDSKNISSTFIVEYIDYDSISKSVIISSKGTVNILRSNGTLQKSYSQSSYLRKNIIPRKVNSSGYYNSCAIDNFDHAYCWGDNSYGQLGDGSLPNTTSNPDPVRVFSDLTFSYISVGYNSNCAISFDSHAYCWGRNIVGALGDGTETHRSSPVRVKGLIENSNIISIGVGFIYGCAVNDINKVYCWGSNYYGQLGEGSIGAYGGLYKSLTPIAVKANEPGDILSGKILTQVSVGFQTVCTVSSEGKAYCWGDGTYGQLGDGTYAIWDHNDPKTQFHLSGKPLEVKMDASSALFNKNVTSISVGYNHICALATDSGSTIHKAYCWGNNSYSQLGNGQLGGGVTWGENGAIDSIPTPVAVKADADTDLLHDKDITSISAGYYHTCATTSEYKVYCWGNSSYLGTVSPTSPVPVQVGGLDGVKIISVSVGNEHSCAISTENIIYCWGSNSIGQIGNKISNFSVYPVKAFTPASNFYYY